MPKERKYTKQDIEEFVNTKVLPSINKSVNPDVTNRSGTLAFLYKVGRIGAIEALVRLVVLNITGTDVHDKVKEYFANSIANPCGEKETK